MGEEHQYDVRMSRRVFPTASAGAASLRADASRPITSSRPEFGDIAERTLRQLTEGWQRQDQRARAARVLPRPWGPSVYGDGEDHPHCGKP